MVIKVHIPIFGQHIWYIIEGTKAELKKYSLSEDTQGSFAMCHDNSVIQFFLKKKEITPGIVVHETLHAVNFMCKKLGIHFSDDSEEVYAYLLQHCIREFYKQFNKKK